VPAACDMTHVTQESVPAAEDALGLVALRGVAGDDMVARFQGRDSLAHC